MTEHIETPQEEHVVHEFFLASILLKGLISLAEIIVGTAVLFVPHTALIAFLLPFIAYVPSMHIQSLLLNEIARYTAGGTLFIALYFLPRGLIKIGLIIGLLKKKFIAYPLSLLFLGALVLYQCYQIIIPPHSLIISAITVFDLIVMYFIYREWKIAERHHALA